MKKGSNNKYSKDPIITGLKKSLMSDRWINTVVSLHQSDPSILPGAIKSVNENMQKFIDAGWSVIDSYDYLLKNRVVRLSNDDSLIIPEQNLFRIIVECFTPYRDEVVSYEMLKKITIVSK